jgi:hypothetical protein
VGQSAPGDDAIVFAEDGCIVELVHHLGLGHHRQPRQVGGVDGVEVDPGQAPGVERRALGGGREQRAEPVALVVADGGPVPAQPLDQLRVRVQHGRLQPVP